MQTKELKQLEGVIITQLQDMCVFNEGQSIWRNHAIRKIKNIFKEWK